MKRLLTCKLPFAAIMLLFVLCWSCSEEPADSGAHVHEWEDSTINGNATMNRMKFSIGQEMVVERSAQTRATTTIAGVATFSVGDLIAIAVTQNSNPEEIKLYRVASDGSLEYAGSGEPFIWKKSTVSIRAWSYGTSTNLAYTLTAPETRDYTLETNQQTNGYLELLYCKAANHSFSSSPVTLNFYHQLSRLVINVSHDLSTALSVSSVSVGNAAFPRQAGFTLPTGSSNVGTWTTRSTNLGTITPKTETTQSGYQATYSAVIFPSTYAKDSKMFTLTNSDGNYSYTITESAGQTLTAGNQYSFAINVRDDVTKNPLWWVAQYNLAEGAASFVVAHSTTSQYVFHFDDAQEANVPCYHVPSFEEQISIIPSNNGLGGDGSSVLRLSGTLENPAEFSEIACNVGGTTVAASTSVWGLNSAQDIYAVRFINTPYASAWHYVRLYAPCSGLLIESYLLSGVTTLEKAKAVLAGLASTPFTGSPDAGAANQTPRSTSMTSRCFVQRFLPACGNKQNTSGTANMNIADMGYYWSSSDDVANSSNAYLWCFNHGEALFERSLNKNVAHSVRLFKDERGGYISLADATTEDVGKVICSNGHIHKTVSAVTCGGTASAMIAYIGNQNNAAGTGAYSSTFNHGLAVALTNVANSSGAQSNANPNITWSDAVSGASSYQCSRPSNTSAWFLPTAYQWERMAIGCGSSASFISSDTNFSREAYSFSFGNMRTLITACGGVDFDYAYWTNTPISTYSPGAWFSDFTTPRFQNDMKTGHYCARAVFAF